MSIGKGWFWTYLWMLSTGMTLTTEPYFQASRGVLNKGLPNRCRLAESLQACCLCKKQELVEFHIGHAVIYFRIAFVGGCDEEIGNVHNVQYGHLLLGVHQSAWLIHLA